ncbi:stretch-activated Ca2+-permeable channel component-domain-containing protein [Aspergillus karnatakaensis]|uniref:magnesium transporter CorA family protein n=1 Tax=Aspergillus karnatakaensis TaxID=1810916 RepID=UPI003CCD36FE
MSESARSEKYMDLTRFSTPVPELDDHRFHLDNQPRIDAAPDATLSRQNTAQQAMNEAPQRPDLLHIQDVYRDSGPFSRDFEQVIMDDDRSVNDLNAMGRRFSADPTGNARHGRAISRTHQDVGNRSRESSVSARSSSPPNSVDAFADPRRRERANTLESHAAPDLEAILQRTVSGGTRRPTFSNASVIRPQPGDIQLDSTEDTCVPFEEPGRIPVIDYEELEEFVALNQKVKPLVGGRKQSLGSQNRYSRVFHDLRPGVDKPLEVEEKQSSPEHSSDDLVLPKFNEKIFDQTNEKGLLDKLKNENEPTRFGFFSSESQSTVHAAELGDLILPGDTFRDLFQLGPDGGVWWLDVLNPTEAEVSALSRAFSIHPLTTEDILTQESREKVELFKQYYFVCFRTFYQLDKTSEHFMEPVNFYMVVFRDGVLSFSFTENPHPANVRRRIGKLRDYVSLSSDWICYAMIDDIVDSFGPAIREIEVETEAIEDLVFIARMDDFESFLPRIGNLRKKVMSLMRLLGGKADVIRGFSKRCNEQYSVTPRGDIGLYLGDIQDHVVTMMSNLAHFEKMLSRSHTNYLAQLNVTNLVLGNHANKVLSKVTLIATILVPMNLICGLFGMNVHVPGEGVPGYGWFFGIVGVLAAVVVISGLAARFYKLVFAIILQQSDDTLMFPMALAWRGPSESPMRREISGRGHFFGATVSLTILLAVHALISPTLATVNNFATHGRLIAQDDTPSEFPYLSSFNGLIIEDEEDETGQARGLDLVRRAPDQAYALQNNRYETREILMGEIQYFSFSQSFAANNSFANATNNRSNNTSKRAATTVYLSLTICSKPILNESIPDNSRKLPQLTAYVSTSTSLQDPGPHQSNADQTLYHSDEGYMSAVVSTESDVYIGLVAPKDEAFSGSYSYQMAASTVDFFHAVDDQDTLMSFVDSGSQTALLVTNSSPTNENLNEEQLNFRENSTGVYTIFINNANSTAISGMSRSYCALEQHSQASKGHNVQASMSTRKGVQEQFYVTGLNRSSAYFGVLASGNSTGFENGIVGGGGRVWKPEKFITKADGNCDLIYDLDFCSEVAYAVPSNPSMNMSEIRTKYDNYAAGLYENFSYSLQQVQCNTSNETIFSMAVNCDDCASAYRSWLCAVTIPKCDDYSSTTNSSAVMIRNAAQPFPNGTEINNKTLLDNPLTNRPRNTGLIDEEINPGPYKEVLPNFEVCHNLLRKCPMTLGFACPKGKWLAYSYDTSAGSKLRLPDSFGKIMMTPIVVTLLFSF